MILSGVATCAASALPAVSAEQLSEGRPPVADRRFRSTAIETTITRVKRQINDPMLASIFERCLPNTLDTTVFPGIYEGAPDTFVITGDIDAMWLRDSSAQLWPYLPFAREDAALAQLLQGVVRRQARMILLDPYANAFTRNPTVPALPWAQHDETAMAPGVAERKWEIDSLCYVTRLAFGYWRATGDTASLDQAWKATAWKIVETFRVQQRVSGKGPYSFMRRALSPSDSVPLAGYGNPARPVGMIFSMFRPSDDACIYPLFVPANLFAIQALTQLRTMSVEIWSDPKLTEACSRLITDVSRALDQYGSTMHPECGKIWAYEVDGYGNTLMMDDANAPGLLSLPYLGCCAVDDPQYLRTRQFVLSPNNPYFFKGRQVEGVGGPHIGLGYVWPLSIIMRALTSTNDAEIVQCLRWLRNTTAGTGFMHESFQPDDPSKFTRVWFAWANTMFGELVLKLAATRPALLREDMNPV